MRIAFTHDLQLSDSEDEAEFDTPETVAAITRALRELGHEVEPVQVSGPPSRLVSKLEALAPDLIFNTAEGSRGRLREAFYPALFDQLGLPYTGSDAYTCAVTLDKQLTKLVLEPHGVRCPKGRLVRDLRELDTKGLRFPLIVKPNYEGSSKGITVDSVVDDERTLRTRVVELLERYPTGLLVEEMIAGRDVVVPYVAGASPKTGDVLEPASYRFDPEVVAGRKHQIYDYELKGPASHAVHVEVPADLTAAQRTEAMAIARKVFRTLEVRDAGRIDLRVDGDGMLWFIEVNALPSFEEGASIYLSAALAGLPTMSAVLGAIVKNAALRHGLALTRRIARRRGGVVVGLAYNVRAPGATEESDEDAEFDTPDTISAIRDAIASYGHEVLDLEATPQLPARLPEAGVDVVFNIAEGIEGRARESQVPALLELLGIPYTGSDPTALALALDKGLAKRLVAQAGIATPPSVLMVTGKERLPPELTFPAVIKPLHEGSSKGIVEKGVVREESELREQARAFADLYRQAVLVESFLPGREFTVGLIGERRPRVLPPLEVVFTDPDDPHPIYSFARKFAGTHVRSEVPARVDEGLARELSRAARLVFSVLGCRDVARVDFRLDAQGRVSFIECNPLPGLAPGFSDLCLIADAAGLEYRALIGSILAPALRRMRERRRQPVG